jgi:hypothetical protein
MQYVNKAFDRKPSGSRVLRKKGKVVFFSVVSVISGQSQEDGHNDDSGLSLFSIGDIQQLITFQS